jgi:hypothetical protein
METASRARRYVEMQGYLGLDDETLAKVEPWLRLSPAICMVVAAVGTLLASPWVLWALVPFAVAGVLMPNHPFDVIYTYGFRLLTGGPRLPRSGVPRRFACAVGATWLLATGAAFYLGAHTAGTVLGLALVGVAAVLVTTGFCVPSFLLGLMVGPPHRAAAAPAPSHPGSR